MDTDYYKNTKKNTNSKSGVEGGGPSAPLVENFRNISKMDKEDIHNQSLLLSLLNDKDYVKAILVLGIKKVTWKNELRYDYELHHEKVDKFIDKMEQLGFIVSKRLYHIPDIVYQTLIQCNNEQFYHQSPNVYVLTDYGSSFMDSAVSYISKSMNTNQYIINLIAMIEERTKNFHNKIDEITKKELENDTIQVKFPNGVIIEKETLRLKTKQELLSKAVKLATVEIAEQKQDSLINEVKPKYLTQHKSGQLTKVTVTKQNKNSIDYQASLDQHKALRIDKILTLAQGVSSEEEQEVLGEQHQEAKERLQYYNEEYKELKNEKLEKQRKGKLDKKNLRECDNFIKSLEVY